MPGEFTLDQQVVDKFKNLTLPQTETQAPTPEADEDFLAEILSGLAELEITYEKGDSPEILQEINILENLIKQFGPNNKTVLSQKLIISLARKGIDKNRIVQEAKKLKYT